MPEELPGLLRGGVSRGLGTLFAGQGDRDPVFRFFNSNSNVWKMHLKIISLVCKTSKTEKK